MNGYEKISDLKDTAKEYLTGRYGAAAGMCVLPLLITFCLSSLVSTLLTTATTLFLMKGGTISPATFVILTLVLYLFSQGIACFTGVFHTGSALFFLNSACHRPVALSNLFYGFKECFRKSLTISFVITLVNTICLLPYNVFSALYTSFEDSRWLLPTIVSLAVGLLINIFIALGFSQSYFLLLDFPQYGAKEILLLSLRVMKGHKKRLFLMLLSFLPLLLLVAISFGLGALWVLPYFQMTSALFFLDLMKNRK